MQMFNTRASQYLINYIVKFSTEFLISLDSDENQWNIELKSSHQS